MVDRQANTVRVADEHIVMVLRPIITNEDHISSSYSSGKLDELESVQRRTHGSVLERHDISPVLQTAPTSGPVHALASEINLLGLCKCSPANQLTTEHPNNETPGRPP